MQRERRPSSSSSARERECRPTTAAAPAPARAAVGRAGQQAGQGSPCGQRPAVDQQWTGGKGRDGRWVGKDGTRETLGRGSAPVETDPVLAPLICSHLRTVSLHLSHFLPSHSFPHGIHAALHLCLRRANADARGLLSLCLASGTSSDSCLGAVANSKALTDGLRPRG